MAKIIFDDGMAVEGTVEELIAISKKLEEQGAPAYRRIAREEAQAGDFIIFAKDDKVNDQTGGKYYKITLIDEGGNLWFIDDAGDENVALEYEDFTVYTLRGKEAEQPLQVGDYAKIKQVYGPLDGFEAGDIVQVESLKSGGKYDVAVSKQGRAFRITGFTDACNLAKATDEEVAQAERKAAAEAKWAKIGRKPNEFKQGDVVKVLAVTKRENADKIGEFFEVGVAFSTHVRMVDGSAAKKCSIELITPVEARFDQ